MKQKKYPFNKTNENQSFPSILESKNDDKKRMTS